MLALRKFCETSGGSSIQKCVKLDREQKKSRTGVLSLFQAVPIRVKNKQQQEEKSKQKG